jgi:hypothetical protein
MSHPLEDIPVLTDIVEDAVEEAADVAVEVLPPAGPPMTDLGELEARLATAVHEQAYELVHKACREIEALLLEQVSDRMRAELPSLIARVLAEHFQGPAGTD